MVAFPEMPPVRVRRVEALVFRVPISDPVQTSFGTMTSRPAVLVHVVDEAGVAGWGEIWCNFPAVGAEHRARMCESCVAPILLERAWSHPAEVFDELTRRLRILAIQCGEPGTIAQVIAGVDIALWDLFARRCRQPLWRLFGGAAAVPVYASGLNPTHPEKLAAARLVEGYGAFKLKVGFGVERDLANLAAMREVIGPEAALMIDANQAWLPEQAAQLSAQYSAFSPHWLEEPIAADQPWTQWQQLAAASAIPLAAGENLRGEDFAEALASGALAVLQPDLGKWGGFSGCLEIGRRAIAAGCAFCPHWLGAGVGLVASLHLKAGVPGPGMVEVDANPNPLRAASGGSVSALQRWRDDSLRCAWPRHRTANRSRARISCPSPFRFVSLILDPVIIVFQ